MKKKGYGGLDAAKLGGCGGFKLKRMWKMDGKWEVVYGFSALRESPTVWNFGTS